MNISVVVFGFKKTEPTLNFETKNSVSTIRFSFQTVFTLFISVKVGFPKLLKQFER